jgi:hypothetical protein
VPLFPLQSITAAVVGLGELRSESVFGRRYRDCECIELLLTIDKKYRALLWVIGTDDKARV